MRPIAALALIAGLVFCPAAARAKAVDERVYLIGVGAVDAKTVKTIKEKLPGCLPMTAKAVIEPQKDLPHAAYDEGRSQYDANRMLEVLAKRVVIGTTMERALFIVDVDLFVPDLNFVFGLADQKKGVCIISLARLRNEFYGLRPDNRLFIDRAVKEAVHELGHTYGMGHCPDKRCVMFFSDSLPDTDRKRSTFCVDCRIKLDKRYGGSLIGPVLPK